MAGRGAMPALALLWFAGTCATAMLTSQQSRNTTTKPRLNGDIDDAYASIEMWPSERAELPAEDVADHRVTTVRAVSQRARRSNTMSAAATLLTLVLGAALGVATAIWPVTTREAGASIGNASTPLPSLPVTTPPPESAPAGTGAPANVDADLAQPAGHVVVTSPSAAVTTVSLGVAAEGRLRVTTQPSEARVTVDGIGWGQTPLTVEHLPLGRRTVRVTRQGYTSQQLVVDIRRDRPEATLQLTLVPETQR